MLRFVKKVFFVGLKILSSFTSVNSLSCTSVKNQEWKTRPQVVNINEDEPVFFSFSIKTSKCSGSCNNINHPYAKICVSNVVKNLNVKVFNLRTNETRYTEWRETCKCECKYGAKVNKQHWNNDKCQCKCKELVDKGVRDKGFIWNPSNCECECDKACDVSEYLDYKNCKCRKKLVDKLVDECAETVEEVKLANITLAKNENKYKCISCTLYIVLFSILFTIKVGIGAYFVYFHWYLKKDVTLVKFDTRTQTTIY